LQLKPRLKRLTWFTTLEAGRNKRMEIGGARRFAVGQAVNLFLVIKRLNIVIANP
jgi:hypothetical protein